MKFTNLSIVGLASLALGVAAQSSASASRSVLPSGIPSGIPGGLSPCALQCVSQAATKDGCGSFANITCVCTSAQFQADALQCLTAGCPGDLATLKGLQAQECGSQGLSASGSATSDGFTGSNIPTGGSASGSSASVTSGSGSVTSSGSATSKSATSGSASGSSGSASTTAPGSASSGAASASNTGNSAQKPEMAMLGTVLTTAMVGLLGVGIGGMLVL